MPRINIKWIITICLANAMLIYSCKTHFKLANESYTLKQSPENVANGKNLVFTSCSGCHYNRTANKLIGNRMNDLPRILGKLYSANLTNSEMYGITRHYTDAQLSYLIKTGIKNNGRFIPYMLRPNMADADVNDIIAYLRSKDAAVAAGDTTVGTTHLNFFGRLAIHTRKPEPFVENIHRPDDAITNGRYYVDIAGCFHCHSKGLTSLNYLHPEKSKHYMQGGEKFKTPNGEKIHASNLTPDKGTGIGYYSKADFRKAVKDGVTPDGRQLRPPMDKYDHLTDKQVDDVYAYIQTLSAKYHHVKGQTEMDK